MIETKQLLFTTAVRGLHAQGYEQSVDSYGNCLYRGDGGRKCAVGHLIPDERYDPTIDNGYLATSPLVLWCIHHELPSHFGPWLRMLQRAHDGASSVSKDMRERLVEFCVDADLVWPEGC